MYLSRAALRRRACVQACFLRCGGHGGMRVACRYAFSENTTSALNQDQHAMSEEEIAKYEADVTVILATPCCVRTNLPRLITYRATTACQSRSHVRSNVRFEHLLLGDALPPCAFYVGIVAERSFGFPGPALVLLLGFPFPALAALAAERRQPTQPALGLRRRWCARRHWCARWCARRHWCARWFARRQWCARKFCARATQPAQPTLLWHRARVAFEIISGNRVASGSWF